MKKYLCFVFLVIQGCTTARKVELEVMQDMFYVTDEQDPIEISEGETLTLQNQAVYFEKPGHVGMLVVPLNIQGGSLDLKLRTIQNWGGVRFEKKANGILNDLVAKIIKIQKLINMDRALDGLAEVEELQEDYPDVHYLYFIKASCLMVLGRKNAALIALTQALKKYPKDESGLALYQYLSKKSE